MKRSKHGETEEAVWSQVASRPSLANNGVERDRCVRDPNLVLIRDLIYRNSGIFQPDNKLYTEPPSLS